MKNLPRPLLYLLLAGGLIRLLWVLYSPAIPVSDFETYNGLAQSLLRGGSLSSSYRVPGWPVAIYLVYRLFGEHILAVKLLNVLMGTLTVACVYWMARTIQPASPKTALTAGLITAFFPSLVLYTALLASETIYIFLLTAATALFLHALNPRRLAPKLAWLAAAGAVLGLSALVRPMSLAIPAAWFLYALIHLPAAEPAARSAAFTKRILSAAQAVFAGVVCLAVFFVWPWYNHTQTGRWIIQNNGGLNWYLGFNPRADGYYSGVVLNQFLDQAKADGLDEFQTDQRAYQLAFEYIRQNPLRSLALAPLKWFHLFKHDVSGVNWNYYAIAKPPSPLEFWGLALLGQAYYLSVLLVCVLAGIAWVRQRRHWSASLNTPAEAGALDGFALLAGSYLLLWLGYHALTIGVDRFHLPLLPVFACLAAGWLVQMWEEWKPDPADGSPYQWKSDPHSSHSLALGWLRGLPASARILDIGCAQGRLGEFLAHPPDRLSGIEPNPAWAAEARRWYGRVANSSLEQVSSAELRGHDAVLLLDVLEHLADAPYQLSRVAAALPAGGQILISIPNIAHLYVRLSLLFGRFDYAERGLLDRTHLHFYTRKSFLALLNDCGLVVRQQMVTPVPLPLVSRLFSETWIGRLLHSLNAWAARLLPGLLGYQLMALVERDPRAAARPAARQTGPKVVIIMPAYNAERTLLRTFEEIPDEYRRNIILTDDCSTDGTVALARSLGLHVIVHPVNRGYGGNQKTCYRAALDQSADIVVMLHPDHQYDARIIPQMIAPIAAGRADAVFGSRMLGHMPMLGGMPAWKYAANVLLTACANLVFGRYLTEIHSGFRAYSRKYLQTVRFEENSDDFIFDTQIIAQGMNCGLLFTETPIETRYFAEASSINLRRSIIYGFGILWTLARYGLHRQGLAFFKDLTPTPPRQ